VQREPTSRRVQHHKRTPDELQNRLARTGQQNVSRPHAVHLHHVMCCCLRTSEVAKTGSTHGVPQSIIGPPPARNALLPQASPIGDHYSSNELARSNMKRCRGTRDKIRYLRARAGVRGARTPRARNVINPAPVSSSTKIAPLWEIVHCP
jgi:hypothetical protein